MATDPDNDNDDDTNDPNDTQDARFGPFLVRSSTTRGTSHAKANRRHHSHAAHNESNISYQRP